MFGATEAQAANPPRVIGVAPASGLAYGITSGLTTGGTTVKVRGSDFTGATAVKFDSASAASFTVDSANQITAVTPAGAAGIVHVSVTTADGTSASSPGDQFRYGLTTPSGLNVDVTGVTQVELRWQPPAVAGVLGYRVYRDGSLIQSFTGALRTNFLDTGLAANSSHSYQVSAQTVSGDTGLSNTVNTTTATAQVINSCNPPGPGHYVLGSDLTADGALHCFDLRAADSGTSIDCNGHSISGAGLYRGIHVSNTAHFLIVNCVLPHSKLIGSNIVGGMSLFNATFGTIANNTFVSPGGDQERTNDPDQLYGSNIVYSGNTITSGQLAIESSQDNYIGHNTISAPSNFDTAAIVSLASSSNTVVDSNILDGGAPVLDPENPHMGADDAIVGGNDVGDVYENNLISDVWDAGIETTGYVYNTAIVGNTIDGSDQGGISAFADYGTSWFNSYMSGNSVNDALMLFDIGTGDHPGSEPETYFKFNTFDNNSLTNPRIGEWKSHLASANVKTDSVPGVTPVVGDNVFSNNSFGAGLGAPHFSPGTINSNMNNRCAPAGGQYAQMDCTGSIAGAPTVTSLSASSGSSGTPITITGTGFTGAQSVMLWRGSNDPLNVMVPVCSSPGAPSASCFTVNSDTTITYRAPLVFTAAAYQGDVRVSSVKGTSPANGSDKFTLTPGAAPTITSPQPGAMVPAPSFTAQFTVPGGASVVRCSLFDVSIPGSGGSPCSAPSATYSNLTIGHDYLFVVNVEDLLENSSSADVEFTVTPPPPTPTITAPANNAVLTSTTLNANYTVTDNGGGISSLVCVVQDVTLNQQVTWQICNTPSFSYSGLVPGHSYWFALYAYDNFNQVSATSVNFSVDGTPPPVPAITSPTNGALVTTQSPAISGTESENDSTVKVYDGATQVCQATVAAGAWSCTPTSPLSDQSAHALTAKASDTVGNTSAASAASNITVDTGTADAVVSGASLSITTNAGMTDSLQIAKSGSNFTIAQASPAWLKAGAGCSNTDATHITCSATGVTSISINTSDMNDTISSNSTVTIPETITSGTGNDTITGGAGADSITGGTGADTMNGGSGTDTVTYADHSTDVSASADGVAGDDGSSGEGDTIATDVENLTGGSGNDTLYSTSGANVLGCGSGSSDTVSYAKLSSAVTVSLTTTTAQSTGGGGSDTITGCENLTGSQAGDTLTGDTNANTIDGGPGTTGTDTINGGGGTNTVSYASATAGVTVKLTTTASQPTGGAGSDAISNVQNLKGSAFADDLLGGTSNNVINGAGGADTIDYVAATATVTVNLSSGTATGGGGGTDTLTSIENIVGSTVGDSLTGDGNDNVINGGTGTSGTDTITGGNGTDTVSYAGISAALTVNLSASGSQATGGAGSDSLSSIENVIGGSGNDTLTGTSGANVITGGAGSDTVNAGDGNDTVNLKDGVNDANTVCGLGADILNADLTGDTNTSGDCDTVNRS